MILVDFTIRNWDLTRTRIQPFSQQKALGSSKKNTEFNKKLITKEQHGCKKKHRGKVNFNQEEIGYQKNPAFHGKYIKFTQKNDSFYLQKILVCLQRKPMFNEKDTNKKDE